MTHPSLEERVERLEDLIQKLVERPNPWADFAGLWKDDPTFDDFLEIVAAHRLKDEVLPDDSTDEKSLE